MSHKKPAALVLVGNPFSAPARGGTVIGFLRSFRSVGLKPSVLDISSRPVTNRFMDVPVANELDGVLVSHPGRGINIYHLNGDEIEISLAHLRHRLPDGAYNVVYPFWELGRYPAPWAKQLGLFDEVWSPSLFVQHAVEKSVSKPIFHMPLPAEVRLSSFLGRRYFRLPESSFLFLFFLDFRSYTDRKNPLGLIGLFERICQAKPYVDVRLVLKVHGADASPQAHAGYEVFLERIRESPLASRIILFDRFFSDNEVKNLLRCCDCFISLHRSEGFGLGMAEAMYLGKPVIATAYSGNLDFMNDQTACMVNYRLIPVRESQYPYADGQVWADPDLDQAANFALRLLDNPAYGRELGRSASRWMRVHFSYLAMGLRYRQRVDLIMTGREADSRADATRLMDSHPPSNLS